MRKQLITIALLTVLLVCFAPQAVQAGWISTSAGMTYQTASGNAVGLVQIGDAFYYFDQNGIMQTGVQQWNRELYFFSLMSGKMLRGWIRNGALTYYADPESGALYRNRTLGSYVFLSDGTLAGGGAGGSTGTTGWVKKKNKRYYYDETGQLVTGLAVIDGKRYVFNSRGVLQKGGWVKADGVSYYAGKDGVLKTSQWIKKTYYVTETGERAVGFRVIKDKLYYFGPKKGKLRTGRIKVNGKLYLAASNGVIKREKLFRYNGRRYYANADGSVAVGLTRVRDNFYFFRKNGVMVTGKRKKVNGTFYYFQKNGKAARNKWVKIKKKYYYFQDDGTMAVNQFIGSTYYVGADGVRVKRASTANGLTKLGGKYYVIDQSGQPYKSQFVVVNGKTFYCGADGAVLIGLQTINGKQYYFEDDGVMQADTVVVVGKKVYTLAKDGHVTKISDFKGDAIAAYGLKFVGNRYVYGGNSLTNGTDCSGFAMLVHLHFGIKLMRVADDQMKGPSAAYQALGYKKGYAVTKKNLQPGDLVFYGSSGYASHVAIYIGNDMVVHAANTRLGIIKSTLTWTGNPIKYMRYWA